MQECRNFSQRKLECSQKLKLWSSIIKNFNFFLRKITNSSTKIGSDNIQLCIIDNIQLCIIDNIWNIPTTPKISNHKIAIINALTNYFITTVQKPMGMKFSCYVVYSKKQTGIYSTWEEVKYTYFGQWKILI